MRRQLVWWSIAFMSLGLVACGDDEVKGTVDTVLDSSAPDADVADTVFIPFDSAPTSAPDTGSDVADTATAPPDTSTPDDVTSGCNTFGCACQQNADCLDGHCVEGQDGPICTRTCIESCPDGFQCVQTVTSGDPVSLCVPQFTRICRPCHQDGDCQAQNDPFPAYCVPDDDPRNGSFCAASCASRACPDGYTCSDVTTQAGGTARECIPTSGECSCRPAWNGLGFTTDCKVVNAFGACGGTRGCGPNGLTACTGPQATPELCDGEDNDCNGTADDIPAVACLVTNGFGSCNGTTACGIGQTTCAGPEAGPETCNGKDDNCNGQTDEGSCEDGLACTTDSCRNGSDCDHALNPGQCLINGGCWSSSAFNPLNACQVCDPARSTVTWSQTPNTCVIGDACYPSGAVNPQNACQICNPNQTASAWTTSGNTCQIGGQCYLQNDPNPNNPCEICVPSTSTTTWTQASNTCNIQGQCYAAGVKKPGESCFVCDPTRSASGWSPAAQNTSCDDQSACSSDDHCDGAGSCVGNKSCNDGIACTQDVCTAAGCNNTAVTAGQCRIAGTCRLDGTANPQNGCQLCNALVSQTAWSPQAPSVGCSDGQYCTIDDHCDGAGACTGGTTRNCSDAFACTSDSCNESNDSCSNTLQGGKCIINGSCYSDGDAQSGNVCNECKPSTSTTSWTFRNGKVCNDNDSCSANDVCGAGTCDGTDIVDRYEPNNSPATPYNLGGASDGDWVQFNFADAFLYGPGDIDWYTYTISDDGGPLVRPEGRLEEIDAGHDYELCMYFRCTNQDALPVNLNCSNAAQNGGTVSTGTVTYQGKSYKGCCVNRSGNGDEGFFFDSHGLSDSDMECPGSDDDYRVLTSVRNVGSNWSCAANYRLRLGDH